MNERQTKSGEPGNEAKVEPTSDMLSPEKLSMRIHLGIIMLCSTLAATGGGFLYLSHLAAERGDEQAALYYGVTGLGLVASDVIGLIHRRTRITHRST